MDKTNQTIKCDVTSCKYNDDSEYLCNLKSINVSCTCNNCDCKNKIETICESFEEKE